MKPLNKTYRIAKTHKAKQCRICAEQIKSNRSEIRRRSKMSIQAEVVDYFIQEREIDYDYWLYRESLADG